MALLKQIIIEIIPHSEQRYPTCGDWQDNGEIIKIKVSDSGNWKFNALVAVHELCEVLDCRQWGVTDALVDLFDKDFEASRPEGNTDEPGDSPHAPYRKQHFFATNIERQVAAELEVDWKEYEEAINSL